MTPEDFKRKYRLLIADADDTLRRCTVPGQPCPNKSDQWTIIPEVLPWFKQIDWGYYCLGIASNQGGIELGYLDEETAYEMLRDLAVDLTEHFPPIGSLQICPSLSKEHPDRKPNPGMLHKIMAAYRVRPSEALVVGDLESDRLAAENAHCDFVWAWDLFGFAAPEGGDRTA